MKLHEWLVWHHALIVAVFAAAVFLFYALFDLLPKMLFRAHPNQLCLAAANVFRPVHFVLRPLVWLVKTASTALLRWTGGHAFTGRLFGNREEMRAVMQESAQALTTDERAMINRVLDLQNFTVRQIATPLAQTVAVEAQTPIRDVLALAREQETFAPAGLGNARRPAPHRRLAGAGRRCCSAMNSICDKPASAHMTPALFLDEDMRLEVALRRMQRAGQRLAIVLGRDRSEIGIVSLEDILKVMFGEVKL